MRVRKTHGGAASLRVGALGSVEEETNGVSHSDQSVFERIDVLVTADMSPKLANLIEKSIRKHKIPLIAESQSLAGTETCVAVDNYQAGFELGKWAGQYAQEHCDGQAHVLDLAYHRPNTLLRSQGFLAGLRAVIPTAELMLSINTQSRYDMAYQLTATH